MHQRIRCAACHHWTDALLIWAAGDCCPHCNAPITLGEQEAGEQDTAEQREAESSGQAAKRAGWRAGERPRRSAGRLGDPSHRGEQWQQRYS